MTNSKVERGRFASRKKVEAVLRVLCGDDLDLVSCELGLAAAWLSEWPDQFLASGHVSLKSRTADEQDTEVARLKTLVGDLTMRLELSRGRSSDRMVWSESIRNGA